MDITFLTEIQKLADSLNGTIQPQYDAVFETNYTVEEMLKAEKLKKHFNKNPTNDVRDYIETVRVLFPTENYLVGSGGNHIFVHRKSDLNTRLLFISTAKNCETWKPKTNL